ncbi:serine hydrolase domain-containing protein [Membranihabitans maritimus]|uniref:serine hydrolase domain-containing protein n=1 Tax=Membranihabitans maritimus TaxID=2904244 RepID=UPI001F41C5BB|nr:serine hydrolase domain-containing protein [Membranihabitans maritimus]
MTQKILIAYLLLLSGCELDLQLLPDTIETEVNKSIERGFDGIIIYVNQDGNSTLYSAGWKNREDLIPADPHALFKIGSISKLYIAAATTKLIANHQLSPDNTLVRFIPETAGRIENADKITLKMMLQHRSGIPEYIYQPDFPNRDPQESYMETASLIFDKPADFKPDKKIRYSNTNYLLIGEILDRTLGYSHHEYIRNEILIPLGLNNTYSLYREADSSEVMSGYYVGHDADLKPNDHTRPGGSMVASAEDVGLFLRALIDGTLFNEEEQAIYSSVYVYEHTGWLDGYTSIARYHSDTDAVVVQFVNTSSNEFFWLKLKRVYNRIVKILEKGN